MPIFSVQALGKYEKDTVVISNTEKKYIFGKSIKGGIKLQFMNTFRFVVSNLDYLTKNFAKYQFRETTVNSIVLSI